MEMVKIAIGSKSYLMTDETILMALLGVPSQIRQTFQSGRYSFRLPSSRCRARQDFAYAIGRATNNGT